MERVRQQFDFYETKKKKKRLTYFENARFEMSLTKKDPSLRVAANDPHLVSLGGGRLSTAVTIHYIPIGDTTIGSSTTCSISLNGTGVRSIHCTIYRSEENEVTIVPEEDARILIDGTKITHDTNLTQGAMITIGNSNYLRFNNPAEAQMMRSAMGSNERISMPQIDFTQVPQIQQQRNSIRSISGVSSNGSIDPIVRQSMAIDTFYEASINPMTMGREPTIKTMSTSSSKIMDEMGGLYNNVAPIDINGLQCPKVFTADLVTVNMPAKDVLGQKYANFAKNLAENHRNDKNMSNALRNNQVNNLMMKSPSNAFGGSGSSSNQNAPANYVNIPSTSNYIQNTTNASTSLSSLMAGNTQERTSFGSTEYLTKVNNTTAMRVASNSGGGASNHHHNITPYDRYPKPGTYGGLQIYPMNGVNTEINNGSANSSPSHRSSPYENSQSSSPATGRRNQLSEQKRNLSNLSNTENERLEDMLKICTEYADRQNQTSCSGSGSITSSPIVQNRIKTNGSLPRDKKSPFYHDLSGTQLQQSFTSGSSSNLAAKSQLNGSLSFGYENVRLIGQNRVEINGQLLNSSAAASASPKTGYENVVIGGKYVPQSPRTKIRTTCMSPKKEHSFSCSFGQPLQQQKQQPPPPNPKPPSKQTEYEQLIKTFEEKLKLEMQAIEESSRYQPATAAKPVSAEHSPARRTNKNINNLTLNLKQSNSLQNSPKLQKKPTPAPRTLSKASTGSSTSLQRIAAATCNSVAAALQREEERLVKMLTDNTDVDVDQLKHTRKELLSHLQTLKNDITELQKQEDEVLRELDMEKALVTAEVNSVGDSVGELEVQLKTLQNKIHCMEAQRNATRVMEENQQAKLKQSIEMKLDQVKKLKAMLKQKPNNDCLKEELHNVSDSLENDRKTFEDLEFQYLEEESEWHAYREELHSEEKSLMIKIEEKRLELQHLKKQELENQSTDIKMLKNKLITLLNELKDEQERLKYIENNICDRTGQLEINSSDDDDTFSSPSSVQSPPTTESNLIVGVMSQSLFGSAELLCPKRTSEDVMSKSVNENMFYNNKIELPTAQATSTPNRPQLHIVDIDDADLCSDSISELRSTRKSTGEDLMLRRSKCNTDEERNERIKFNLSLGSDDFEVNPLERRIPSQDDIDRICKVTSDAPISTKGATTKIFDSIKEIERNRQLLLAQQGHHVIEHERQKMHDLKKKCHDEARAQYLSMLNYGADGSNKCSSSSPINSNRQHESREMRKLEGADSLLLNKENPTQQKRNSTHGSTNENRNIAANAEKVSVDENTSQQQRHSQPEFVDHHQQQLDQNHQRSSPRPLSEANSELSCDLLSENAITCKSSIELSSATTTSGIGSSSGGTGNRYSAEQNTSGDDATTKRSSVNSNETTSGGSASGNSGGERKRALPKHQRPLTRYLPIFSPDLNLRHHIESAGHQIALCPHVFVDANSCRGYLHKLGATFHGWARRWFVLDRKRNAFIYYADKSERKPRGGAYFSTIDEVYLDHLNASKSGRPHCTFIVKTKKRSYHLQAASDAAARIWIDAIITGAQGNLDY